MCAVARLGESNPSDSLRVALQRLFEARKIIGPILLCRDLKEAQNNLCLTK